MQELRSTFLYVIAYFLGAHTFMALLGNWVIHRVVKYVLCTSDCLFLEAGTGLCVMCLDFSEPQNSLRGCWSFSYNILTYRNACMTCLEPYTFSLLTYPSSGQQFSDHLTV